jgi:hypothetical protein
MPPPNNTDLRLAVLIDAAKVPAKAIHVRMPEIANHGKATSNPSTGTSPATANGWKGVLNERAITPSLAQGTLVIEQDRSRDVLRQPRRFA